jgi:hypothetical protein
MNTEEADDAYRHLAELKQEAAMILKLLADERKRGGDGDTAARRRLADVTSTMKALEDEIHNFEAGMVSDDDTEANRDFAGQLVADDKVRTPEPKSAWPVYIQERFGSPINSEVERVLAATVEAANAGRGKLQNNLVTVNTRAFLFPLTENDGPFTLLRLRQSAGEDAGRPPWHESQEMNEEQTHALREAFGKTRPSQEFLGVLEEASSLALKYRFQDQGCMTEWHLAFALLVRRPTGFKWQIQWHGYQIAEVAGILKAKMFSTVPYLANALDWALTELAVENRSIEQSEAKSDLQNQRNKKSRDDAYNLLRNPKGFEWSSSCKNAIETLLNFHHQQSPREHFYSLPFCMGLKNQNPGRKAEGAFLERCLRYQALPSMTS